MDSRTYVPVAERATWHKDTFGNWTCPEKRWDISNEVLWQAIDHALNDARNSWHWGEGLDMPVLRIRVGRILRGEVNA